MLTREECQEIIQDRMNRIILPEIPANLYDPIRYMLGSEGKRIRPALVLIACNVFSDSVEKAIYPALAVEVFHNFTLMHDDIMDQSVMRRNKPSVHVRWNPNVAILSGDAMLIKAFELLSYSPSESLPQILALFNKTALKVCEGQQFDMDFEQSMEVSIEQYLRMIELKTAVLLAAALKVGAITGGAGDKDAETLYDYGLNLGIAFQLQDDLLDVYADQHLFGKMTGNDIVSNKKTALLIQALQISKGSLRADLLHWLKNTKANREEKISHIREIYDAIGVEELTRKQIRYYHELALSILCKLPVAESRKGELFAVSDLLMNRKK